MRSLIMRTVKKDESYINTLNNMFLEIMYALKEYKVINLNFNLSNIHKISSILYYVVCYYGSKSNSIGEEYLNIKKFNTSIIYIILNTFKNEIIYFIYKNAYFLGTSISKIFSILNFEYEDFCKGLSDIELCILFLTGKYNSFFDLILGSKYENISTGNEDKLKDINDNQSNSQIFKSGAFKILSYGIIYSYLFKLKINIEKFYTNEKNIYSVSNNEKNNTKLSDANSGEFKRILNTKHAKLSKYEHDCLICLEQIDLEKNDAALTSCGHVYCWECISDSIQENPKCPKCRKQIYLNDLIII